LPLISNGLISIVGKTCDFHVPPVLLCDRLHFLTWRF